MKQHGSLETVSNFVIWTSAVLFSIYRFHYVGDVFSRHGDPRNRNDFQPGLFDRHRDISDFEWNACSRLFGMLLPWLMLNFLVGSLLHAFAYLRVFLPFWYAGLTIMATSYTFSQAIAGGYGAMVVSFYIVAKAKFPAGVWGLAALWWYFSPFALLIRGDEGIYFAEVASCWILLKCIRYGLEVANGTRESSWPLILGYSFYLPTFFFGPLLSLPLFAKSLNEPSPPWSIYRVNEIIKSFFRIAFWASFTILITHFVYVSAITARPDMIAEMSTWQLNGFGIAMGQFFHLKYIVFYGLPSAWAAAEGYIAPPPPSCVSRISLYSDMWRKFDPGLYEFLISCIYVPLQQQNLFGKPFLMKCFSSMCCFIFVFIWHGAYEYVFYWALLNFVSVTIEGYATILFQKPKIRTWISRNLTEDNQRRLLCLLIAPLQYFSMLSNYFFIGSYYVGIGFFTRVYNEPGINFLYILFFMYGAAQTSLTIRMWEQEKKNKKKKKKSKKS